MTCGDDMESGKIVHLGHDGFYGFISGNDGREFYFNHQAASNFDQLKIGDAVEFMAIDVPSAKGPIARAVRKAEQQAVQYGDILKNGK